jgi:O-glycosyl hydrolase
MFFLLNFSFQLANFAAASQALNNGSVTSLTPYETTSAGGLMPQSAVTVSSGQFNDTLPAQSIVTFVQ